jgi:hypothetical protein
MNEKKKHLAGFGLEFGTASPRLVSDQSQTVATLYGRAFGFAHTPSKPLDALLRLIGRNDENGVERLRRIVTAYLQMDQRRQDEAMVRMERIAHTHPKARAPQLRLVTRLDRHMEGASDA